MSKKNLDSADVSLSETVLDLCAIFNTLIKTFGVNFILKYMPNPDICGDVWIRFIIGLVGF